MGFEVKGMEATIAKFQRAAIASEDAVKRAVKAGGKVVAEKLQEKAPVDTGALRDSIKPDAVKYDAANGYYCTVKPVGNHPKTGEPLAKIGNILEYGRSASAKRRKYNKPKGRASNMDARGWFHPTVKEAESEAFTAMQKELDKRMGAVK